MASRIERANLSRSNTPSPIAGAWYDSGKVYFFAAGVVGLLTSIAFVYITQYYTAGTFRPVREIAEASKTGPATNIISGMAVGFETTFVTAVTIGIALILSAFLGSQAFAGTDRPEVGAILGTAVATMGMLMTTAYILAMDTFGPITDNAGGIAEMADLDESVRAITDPLDAVGNTTKAVTKGYAIGSAALAALVLFAAFKIDLVEEHGSAIAFNLDQPAVLIGLLIGGLMVYLFAALSMEAVGRAGSAVVEEVRRQFREKPGIMEGTEQPEYGQCVDIVTRAAQREMILPSLIPIVVTS